MAHAEQRPPRHQRHSSRIMTSFLSPNQQKTPVAKRKADNVTVAYIKRTLCQKSAPKTIVLAADDPSAKPLDELLPPLTSSNEIDVQLYAIIAVLLNQFVQSWYNRFTPDADFVSEIVQIIAHCTRGLEERLRQVDLETLLFHELPALLDSHLCAVRVARDASHPLPVGELLRKRMRPIYHSLRHHPAMSPPPLDEASVQAQADNETVWCRLVVTNIIPLVLPPEDLLNPCLNVLVSEIFSEMIFHNAICGKVTEPWLLWEGVTKVIYTLRPDLRSPVASAPSPTSRLDKFGLLSSGTKAESRSPRQGMFDVAARIFWLALQYALLFWALLRAFVTALMHASSLPLRPDRSIGQDSLDKYRSIADGSEPGGSHSDGSNSIIPIVRMGLWACAGHLLSLDLRMPWLTGLLSLLQWLSLYGPQQVCRANGALDRLISSSLHDKVLNPALLPTLLQATRTALFPDNVLAPARQPPTADEVDAIKRECARAIVAVIPEAVRSIYFGTAEADIMRAEVESMLEAVWGDAYVNKGSVVVIVERIVGTLFPELAVGIGDCDDGVGR